MPRNPELFEHTVGEAQALFERLVGPGYDNGCAQRLLRIPVDGVPLGDRRAERQKARSDFYGKQYLEAQEVANMLVQLGLDREVTNLVRRDKPDIAVHFADRDPFYVEHRIVSERGMPFDRHLEQAKHALDDLAQNAGQLRDFLSAGSFMVRLTDPGVEARASSGRELAAEAARLTTEIRGCTKLLKPNKTRYPVLERYAANVFYTPGGPEQGLVFQRDAATFDPRPSWVASGIGEALKEKKAAATGYDPACRPLWLLLTLHGEHLFPDFVRELVVEAVDHVEIVPFDRVVARMSMMRPVVRDGQAPDAGGPVGALGDGADASC